MESLAGNLRNLGYPEAIIKDAVTKAMARDQTDLRRGKKRDTENNVLAFVHSFNPRHPQIFPRILKRKSPYEAGDGKLHTCAIQTSTAEFESASHEIQLLNDGEKRRSA